MMEQGYIVGRKEESLGKYTAKTYLWMCAGLVVTFLVSMLTMRSPAILNLLIGSGMTPIYVILILELVVVMSLSAAIKKIPVGAAYALFFVYAVLNGLTFSIIFMAYEATSAILVFALTAGVFGAMGLWGYFTNVDLSRWRRVLLFGLGALIIVGILGLFLDMSGLELIISLIGVAVFMGFTAYDTQKIKAYYYGLQGDEVMLKKASIISALQLYLDFINLFLYLLRIFGRRR